MNKTLIIIAITFIAININAQKFIGGEIDFNIRNEKPKFEQEHNFMSKEYTSKRTSIGLMIAPKIGYELNPKLALGLSMNIGATFLSDSTMEISYDFDSGKIDTTSKNNKEYYINWGFNPFVRHTVYSYERFFVILEWKTGVSCSHYFLKENDNKTENGGHNFTINVMNVTPVLGFKFTDRLQMEAGLQFLNIYYNIGIFKRDIPGFKGDNTVHDFNIGFNSSNVLSVSSLKLGVVYKF